MAAVTILVCIVDRNRLHKLNAGIGRHQTIVGS